MYISKSLGASYPNSFTQRWGATILSRSAILYNLHFLVGSKIVSLQNVGTSQVRDDESGSLNRYDSTTVVRQAEAWLQFSKFEK